jgi:predicted RNase H-like HicB family nuclease
MVKLGRYTAEIEKDEDGWWVGTIDPVHPDLKGMHTQGKTLPTIRSRVREMLGLEAEDWETAEIEFRFAKKHRAAQAIKQAMAAKAKAAKADAIYQEAQTAQRVAAKALVEAGVAVRDAAEILGVSHQRVQQFTHP